MKDIALLGTRILAALAQAGVLVLLARFTNVQEFGQYGVAIAVGAVALGLISLGLPTRVLLSGQAGEIESRSAIWLLSSGLGALVVPITALVTALVTGGITIAVVAGAIASGAELAGNLHQSSLFGRRSMRRAELVLLLRRAIPLGGVGVSTIFGLSTPYIALAIGTLLAWGVTTFLAFESFRGSRLVVNEVRASRHYWLANIGSMAQQLDVVIVGGVVGTAAAAGFSAAFRLASPVHIVTGLITSRLGPEMRLAPTGTGQKRYRVIGVWYAAAVTISSPLLALASPLLLGAQYSQFYWVFVILYANSGLSVANQVLTVSLFAKGHARREVASITILSSILGLLMVFAGALMDLLWCAALGTLSIQILLLVGLMTTDRKWKSR